MWGLRSHLLHISSYFICHAMRVLVPRPGQLAHLFTMNLGATFWYKNTPTSMRRDWDPFGSRASLLSSTDSSSDVDSEFDVETILDDRTFVESGRHSSHSDQVDLLATSDVVEDEECVTFQCTSQRPLRSSENPDESAQRPIIYPLPSDEELLAYVSTPRGSTIDDLSVPPPSVTGLRPPPSHCRRRRGRIISEEDYDPGPDKTPIRYICVINRLA